MKLILCSFILLLSVFSFSQDKVNEAKVVNSKQFQANKEAGEFKFVFPEITKKEEVERNAAFYKEYFSVIYDESTHSVTIKMVQNNEKNRQIIKRFFVSMNIKQIEMNGTSMQVDEFYQRQLK